MSRLIVVSNRVAPVREGKATAGGLAVAVLSALKQYGGIWFGWSGETVAAPPAEPHIFNVGKLTYATLDLSHRDFEEYYNGYANRTLWPLFHYRLDLTEYNRQTYAGYRRVNQLFARQLYPLLRPDDVIWIHDYHLIPMADELRALGSEHAIGFFLHTPFPPPELLVTLPNHQHLARALCAYDLIGFQTDTDRRGFCDYISYEAKGKVEKGSLIRAYGRTSRMAPFPIGIETQELANQAREAARSRLTNRLAESLKDRDLIIGVDRLDYSKGLPHRFQSYERFLESYPENRSHVTLMQIAPPSRSDVPEYMDIRRELEALSGNINGRFSEFDWVPIRYINKSYNRRTLSGFFRLARIGLVTPLRDGMNLVAKEYVASQDPENPGMLVLSRFAGAAKELDAGLIVNPYDSDEVAEALARGLSMPLEERKERWQAMWDVISKNDIMAWRDSFLSALQRHKVAA